MYSVGAIVHHPEHRVGVVQSAHGRERFVVFIAADDQWVHASELTDCRFRDAQNDYFAKRKLVDDIAAICCELMLNGQGVFAKSVKYKKYPDPEDVPPPQYTGQRGQLLFSGTLYATTLSMFKPRDFQERHYGYRDGDPRTPLKRWVIDSFKLCDANNRDDSRKLTPEPVEHTPDPRSLAVTMQTTGLVRQKSIRDLVEDRLQEVVADDLVVQFPHKTLSEEYLKYKSLTFRDCRQTGGWDLDKHPLEIRPRNDWQNYSEPTSPHDGYVQENLNSRRARNYLKTRLKNWNKKAAETLRRSRDSIWMPKQGFQRTPTNAAIRKIKQCRDFEKIDESVFIPGWWTTKILFGPDPTDWEESLIPRIQWEWRAQPVSISERSFGSVSRSEYRQLGSAPYHSTCRTFQNDHPYLDRHLDFQPLTGPPGELQFQQYMAIHPFKGFGPDEYVFNTDHEAVQEHFTQAGVVVADEKKTIPDGKKSRQVKQKKEDLVAVPWANEQVIDPTAKDCELLPEELPPDEELCEHGFPEARHCPFCPIAYLEIGDDRVPNLAKRPVHKCTHGVSWGVDNCRWCREIVFKGKKARLIWDGVDKKIIKAVLNGRTDDFFQLAGPGEPDFTIVRTSEVDKVLGLDFTDRQKVMQVLEDRMRAMSSGNFCIICGKRVNRELSYCQDCARVALTEQPSPSTAGEIPNVHGEDARFTESKARPLRAPKIEFDTVKLVARTFVYDIFHEVTGREIEQLPEPLVNACFELSPPILTLLRRYWLQTHGTSIADIAAFEGVQRSSISSYFTDWDRTILEALQPLETV